MSRVAFFSIALAACGGSTGSPVDASTSSDVVDASMMIADASSDAPTADVIVDASTPRYNIDLKSTSVSGLSSGGFMAVQVHVGFSSIMKGAAIFAGGPYMCSQGSLTTAVTTCAYGSPAPSIATLVGDTQTNAMNGSIDDPGNLASQHVFLFGGANDYVVSPLVMDALDAYYAAFIGSASIDYVSRNPNTSHTFPTIAYGNACDILATPYVGMCNYDGAGLALAQIYGTLSPAATTLSGTFITIAQGDYVTNPASHSLADSAYAYVPSSCAAHETCKIHIAFHGCLQSESNVGDAFYKHAGYNEWADTNHIIVVYPQTIASTSSPTNPDACWDFWGYDSADFAKKTGPQMAMVRAMIDGLSM